MPKSEKIKVKEFAWLTISNNSQRAKIMLKQVTKKIESNIELNAYHICLN